MKRHFFFILAFVAILLILAVGYGLFLMPKNYEVMGINAKNDSYSVLGLLIGWTSLGMVAFSIVNCNTFEKRILLGIELVLSILLIIAWWNW